MSFRTNKNYLGVMVLKETADYSEISESITQDISITSNNWFRLEWKIHAQSNEIKLHLEENKAKADRQLEFTVYHNRRSVSATVTQLGPASEK